MNENEELVFWLEDLPDEIPNLEFQPAGDQEMEEIEALWNQPEISIPFKAELYPREVMFYEKGHEGVWADIYRGFSMIRAEWVYGTLIRGSDLKRLLDGAGDGTGLYIIPGGVLDSKEGVVGTTTPKEKAVKVVPWSVGMMVPAGRVYMASGKYAEPVGAVYEGDIVRAKGMHPDVIGVIERRWTAVPFMVHMKPSKTLVGYPERISLDEFEWEKVGTLFENGRELLGEWSGEAWETPDIWAETSRLMKLL